MNKTELRPWGAAEKLAWFKLQVLKRSYREEVQAKIEALAAHFEVSSYGALSLDPAKYPLFLVKSKNFSASKETVLITGGVHGYETSGVHGALRFMQTRAELYADFNFLCFPCLSPWAYETINRWNHLALDPNRNFFATTPCEESRLFLEALSPYRSKIFVHFDLHETTDTDNTVFRPALASRDGKEEKFSEIPDGFYVVGDVGREEPLFQRAVIQSVKNVTHIAPPDAAGEIIGVPVADEGVIYYNMRQLSLCGGVTDAKFTTTTEVYPDSPKATLEICIEAQIAAIVGGLEYLR